MKDWIAKVKWKLRSLNKGCRGSISFGCKNLRNEFENREGKFLQFYGDEFGLHIKNLFVLKSHEVLRVQLKQTSTRVT